MPNTNRGEALCQRDIYLAEHSSYRIGGLARHFVQPRTVADLQDVLAVSWQAGLRPHFFGYGSNILFADNPRADSLYISLKHLTKISEFQQGRNETNTNESCLQLAAGFPLSGLAMLGVELRQFKWLAAHLLPGTIGAGIWVNARCYDFQIADILERVYYIDISEQSLRVKDFRVHKIANSDCQFAYKKSIFQNKQWLIIGADFSLSSYSKSAMHDGKDNIAEKIVTEAVANKIVDLAEFYKYFKNNSQQKLLELEQDYIENNVNKQVETRVTDYQAEIAKIDNDRQQKRHFYKPSCGSVFKNNYQIGRPIGALVDDLGLKGKSYGGAMISPWHGNFIINEQQARACDVRYLIEFVQDRLQQEYDFIAEPEVVFVD